MTILVIVNNFSFDLQESFEGIDQVRFFCIID